MRMNVDWRSARVVRAETIAEDVRLVEFEVDGFLPSFEPGSHTNIAVVIDDQRAIRTYTCIPGSPGALAIAVKLHPNSRGGSRFIWSLQPGYEVEFTIPENRFELSWRTPSYLLMAGGIGVTPIYGMARALASRGMAVRMVYGARSREAMPFVEELEILLGDKLRLFEADRGQLIDLEAEIASLPANGELYVCGPLPMLDAVKRAWTAAGRSSSRLRYEVFGDNGKFAEKPFEVSVVNRDITVTVRPDQSMLDALADAGIDMIHDCLRGECGLCAVKVLERDGEIDHRDVFFGDEDEAENLRMCSCVSRLPGGRVLIDIGYRR